MRGWLGVALLGVVTGGCEVDTSALLVAGEDAGAVPAREPVRLAGASQDARDPDRRVRDAASGGPAPSASPPTRTAPPPDAAVAMVPAESGEPEIAASHPIVRAEKIEAKRIVAGVIFAKKIETKRAQIGRVFEAKGEARWRVPWAYKEIKAERLDASIIHAESVKCDELTADEVFAAEVEIDDD